MVKEMKNRNFAAAGITLSLLATPGFAQSSVTLYGLVDVRID